MTGLYVGSSVGDDDGSVRQWTITVIRREDGSVEQTEGGLGVGLSTSSLHERQRQRLQHLEPTNQPRLYC